jgi:outer membrane lipoprotein-sorting protein
MARNHPEKPTGAHGDAALPTAPDGPDGPDEGVRARRRRRAVRFAAPVAAAAVAGATLGLVPALADTGGGSAHPSLPATTPQRLLTHLAGADVQAVSGTVRVSTDLGLPSYAASALSGLGAPGSGSGSGPGSGGRSGSASPGSPSGSASPSAGASASGGSASGGTTSPADPSRQLTQLLAGTHTLRVAADGPRRQKVSLVEPAAEYSLIRDGRTLWAYDSASDAVYHATEPASDAKGTASLPKALRDKLPTTPAEAATDALRALTPGTRVTVAGTTRVAGRAAYDLRLTPKQTDTTVGAVDIAVDARTWTPLRFTLTPRGGGKAVLDIAWTHVSFATPSASTFHFTPPKGAKVTNAKPGTRPSRTPGSTSSGGASSSASGLSGVPALIGKGWSSVAELRLPKATVNRLPLSMLGSRTHGAFGTGTLITTRFLSVLVTSDGQVFAGAVPKATLIAAADAAQ